MTDAMANHVRLTEIRGQAYTRLFGGAPVKVLADHEMRPDKDDPFLIDIFVYEFTHDDGTTVQAAVTNGMSDQRMVDKEKLHRPTRRELIQYFRECTPAHAKRLCDMAWVPLVDEILLDNHMTIAWDEPAIEGTPWKNAMFLPSILRSHREFTFTIDGDEASLLWHIPITDDEREIRRKHGIDELIDRMQSAEMPWVFDETNRPLLSEREAARRSYRK